MIGEPRPPDPRWPRYSARPLPAHRYLPGRSARPDRGAREPGGSPSAASHFDPARWTECDAYRFGIDLYNFAYWWECHEALEVLWRALPRGTPERAVLQGLVQIAAANLKRFGAQERAARRLARKGVANLRRGQGRVLGIALGELVAQVEDYFDGRRGGPPLIRLQEP